MFVSIPPAIRTTCRIQIQGRFQASSRRDARRIVGKGRRGGFCLLLGWLIAWMNFD
jgi:hypothetical protein